MSQYDITFIAIIILNLHYFGSILNLNVVSISSLQSCLKTTQGAILLSGLCQFQKLQQINAEILTVLANEEITVILNCITNEVFNFRGSNLLVVDIPVFKDYSTFLGDLTCRRLADPLVCELFFVMIDRDFDAFLILFHKEMVGSLFIAVFGIDAKLQPPVVCAFATTEDDGSFFELCQRSRVNFSTSCLVFPGTSCLECWDQIPALVVLNVGIKSRR